MYTIYNTYIYIYTCIEGCPQRSPSAQARSRPGLSAMIRVDQAPMCISLSFSLCIHIYIYIYACIAYVYIYIYMYIYM